MDVAIGERVSEHPKKRRRRDNVHKPILGRLVLDDNARGDVGVLSQDLIADLDVGWQGQSHIICASDSFS